jgi:hypothetical protein
MLARQNDAEPYSRVSLAAALRPRSLARAPGHPPTPPLDGICDLQAFIADCTCGEPPTPPPGVMCTWLPEKVGSAKSGTPWARMHLAQSSHCCCCAGESCWPPVHHWGASDLHASWADWKVDDCGFTPSVRYP